MSTRSTYPIVFGRPENGAHVLEEASDEMSRSEQPERTGTTVLRKSTNFAAWLRTDPTAAHTQSAHTQSAHTALPIACCAPAWRRSAPRPVLWVYSDFSHGVL